MNENKELDMVNHPPHYTTGNIEVIDYIEDKKLGFHLGNTVKYISRANHKGTPGEDLNKAKWYLDRYLELIEIDSIVPVQIDQCTHGRHNWLTVHQVQLEDHKEQTLWCPVCGAICIDYITLNEELMTGGVLDIALPDLIKEDMKHV